MAALITNLISNVTAPVNYQLMEGLLSAAKKRLPYFNGSLPGELMENGGTSIPLDATSVATRMSALPLRNFPMDCSLLCCDISPSIATASNFSWCRNFATSLVLYLVEQNTMD